MKGKVVNEALKLEIATFRFGVIADFVTGQKYERGEKEKLLSEKSERVYSRIPGTMKTRISRGTIQSWIRIYRAGGGRIECLMPKPRDDKGKFKAIPQELQSDLTSLRREHPEMTLPVMLQKIGAKKLEDVHLSTLYRFLGNIKTESTGKRSHDRRRFEVEFPNQMWQCDVMHGPMVKTEKSSLKKGYLIAIIDDHSRLIVHAQFYLSETLECLKDCLRQAVEARGLPQKFYVDNGACFRAGNLEECLASLGVGIAHSRPYIPQGRGKIERWFRYVRQSFIPVHADRPLRLCELNEKLAEWVDSYNSVPHGSTKMSPYDRFRKDLSCVRPAPENLLEYFRMVVQRKVRKDRTIQISNIVYEVAIGLIDRVVEARFHQEHPEEIEIYFEGRSYGQANKLDAELNSRLGREGLEKRKQEFEAPARTQLTPPKSGGVFGRSL